MRHTGWLAAGAVAALLAGTEPVASATWPDCRAELRALIATNTLALWASRDDGELRYVMRIDADRWQALGSAGQHSLQALLSCSISAGDEPVPHVLSVRSAYSNRELARYRDGEQLTPLPAPQGEPEP